MKYHIIENPIENDTYHSLLNWAQESSKCFSLVWRKDFKFKNTAKIIETELKPYLIKEQLTNEWPGTKVCSAPDTTIRFYKVTKESINILRSKKSIGSWLAPDYPEDLAFYNNNNEAWFGSVAHEQMAFFFGDDFDRQEASRKIQGIKITN